MPVEVRSSGNVLLSLAVGLIFTAVTVTLTAFAVYYLSDALTGWPRVSKLRVGIVAIAVALIGYWTCVGLSWVTEDVGDLIQRRRSQRMT
ncbi:MAG: hypothetical protein AB7O44_03960 [Hyphomicrobiaceae bacterium]